MRGHAPRSKTRINLDSNEGNNDGKDDDDNDSNTDVVNSSGDDKDGGGGDDEEDDDDWGNNFLFTERNSTDSGLPLNHFIGKKTFAHCTKMRTIGAEALI